MRETVIRILNQGDKAALEAFLLPRVESSMFLISNLRASGLSDEGEIYQGTYAARFTDGRISAVASHYWNKILALQAPDEPAPLCELAVRQSRRELGGLVGPRDQVGVAKQALGIDDSNVQMDETEKLYRLDLNSLVVPLALASGRVNARRMGTDDVDLIAEWRVGYAIEASNDKDTPELRERWRGSSERAVNERRTWILEDEAKPVACSSFNAAIGEAVQVGGVWTPPRFRSRGYARAVVAASLLDARAEGAKLGILFTGEHNITAQKAYEALGFRHIGDYRIMLLSSPFEKTG
ncbi:MAG: GNAT family N-acetyltransferase [Acidobacteriota bacterium]